MTNLTKAVVVFAALCITAATAKAQELAPLPVELSAERLQTVASLSPFAEPIASGMPPAEAKQSIRVFTSQGRWPILVEYEDGSKYWGEISEIGWNTFKLLNRKTNREEMLSYAGIRSMGIVDGYGVASKFSIPKPTMGHNLPQQEPEPELTPEDVPYRRVVQHLGMYPHRFVHCELKNRSVVTGAIVAVGQQDFTVRPGTLHDDRVIPYRELSAPPRPTSAVGAHFKNGLEMTGLVAFCVLLFPVCVAALGD